MPDPQQPHIELTIGRFGHDSGIFVDGEPVYASEVLIHIAAGTRTVVRFTMPSGRVLSLPLSATIDPAGTLWTIGGRCYMLVPLSDAPMSSVTADSEDSSDEVWLAAIEGLLARIQHMRESGN